MGGGGVVRTAAKAAALGGYRTAHAPWVRKVSCEADEWEFAGGEEEGPSGVVLHRAPPTLEEAKEAASDLKDALRGLYSPHAFTGFRSSSVESRSASSVPNCSEGSDAKKGCAAVLTSAPKHVAQAFTLPPSAPRHIVHAVSLLQESPEVQNIVASLASDINVWDAVMKNEKVIKFCKTHKNNAPLAEAGERSEESVNENGRNIGSPVHRVSPQSSENGLGDFMHTIKLKVKEMVNSLSDLFENLMRPTGPGCTTIMRTNSGDMSYEDIAVGASFIALTIATIILVVLKRE